MPKNQPATNLAAFIALILAALPLGAQTPAAPSTPTFEAAAIKPAADTAGRGQVAIGMGVQPGETFNTSRATLAMLIQFAYDLKPQQVLGAGGWMTSDGWDIQAKGPEGPPLSRSENEKQTRLMLQALLADRFGLKTHTETRPFDVYYLTVAKGGPKLTPDDRQPTPPGSADPDTGARGGPPPGPPPPPPGPGGRAMGMRGPMPPGAVMMGPGIVRAEAAPTARLADVLSNDLGELVIDKTGLTGTYDFTLQWTPGPGEGMRGPGGRMMMPPPGADGAGQVSDTGPSIFTAVEQQLGLKLETGKGPVDVLVIDHAEKPSGN